MAKIIYKCFFAILITILFYSSPVEGQWTSLNTGTIEYLYNVNFPTQDTGYIVLQSGLIKKSENGGQNWSVVNSSADLLDFAFINVQTGFGIDINSTTIYRTNDGGIVWDTAYSETGITLAKIYNNGSDFIYAVGGVTTLDSGLVICSYDGGSTWTRNSFQDGNWDILYAASFLSPAIGYSTDVGSIYKTLDSGQTWVNLNVNQSQVGNSVYFISPDTGFSMATSISRTTDGGISWTMVNTNGNNTAFYDMRFINDSVGYVVGGNGFNAGPILKTTDGGINWDLDTAIVQTFIAITATENSLYVSGTGGALWKTDLTSGISENVLTQENISLIHDFSNHQIIVNGTKVNGSVLIYDSVGKLIKKVSAENGKTVINLNSLSSGIYMFHYLNKSQFATFKGIRP